MFRRLYVAPGSGFFLPREPVLSSCLCIVTSPQPPVLLRRCVVARRPGAPSASPPIPPSLITVLSRTLHSREGHPVASEPPTSVSPMSRSDQQSFLLVPTSSLVSWVGVTYRTAPSRPSPPPIPPPSLHPSSYPLDSVLPSLVSSHPRLSVLFPVHRDSGPLGSRLSTDPSPHHLVTPVGFRLRTWGLPGDDNDLSQACTQSGPVVCGRVGGDNQCRVPSG